MGVVPPGIFEGGDWHRSNTEGGQVERILKAGARLVQRAPRILLRASTYSLMDSAGADPASNVVAASSTMTLNEAGELDGSVRARISRNPIVIDEGLLRQIRAIVPSDWEDKTVEELQRTTTLKLTEYAKGLLYIRFTGQRKSVSVSGSKAAVIGRILAWQRAREQGGVDRKAGKSSVAGEESAANELWSADETARLVLTMTDGETYSSVAKIFRPASRQEIDASKGPVSRTGWMEVAQKYNDDDFMPENPFSDDVKLKFIDPSVPGILRSADCIRAHMASLRSLYTVRYNKWSRSGQNDPETFWNFCCGNTVLLFMFHVLKGCPAVKNLLIRKLPQNIGVDTAAEPIQTSEFEEQKVGKKRKRSNSFQSEAASTLFLQADGLEEAMKESASRKIEEKKPLIDAQLEQFQASAVQQKELAMNHRIKNARDLQELEELLLASIEKYEAKKGGEITERSKKRLSMMEGRLAHVQKKLESLYDM